MYVQKYISWIIYPMLRRIYQLSLPDTLIIWFQMLFLVGKWVIQLYNNKQIVYMIIGPIYQENKVGQGNMVYHGYNYLTFSNNRHIKISFACFLLHHVSMLINLSYLWTICKGYKTLFLTYSNMGIRATPCTNTVAHVGNQWLNKGS